jgi:hypothetical protein
MDSILDNYDPYHDPITSMLLDGRIKRLSEYLHELGNPIDASQYYGLCDLCSDCMKAINGLKPS